MASERITKDKAESIARALADDTFKDEKEAYTKATLALSKRLYNAIFNKTLLKTLEAVPEAYLQRRTTVTEEQSVSVSVAPTGSDGKGVSFRKYTQVSVLVPAGAPWYTASFGHMHEVSPEVFAECEALNVRFADICNRHRALRLELIQNALRAGTVKRLLEAWPEATDVINKYTEGAPARVEVPLERILNKHQRLLTAPNLTVVAA